jgi:hypothetical protein
LSSRLVAILSTYAAVHAAPVEADDDHVLDVSSVGQSPISSSDIRGSKGEAAEKMNVGVQGKWGKADLRARTFGRGEKGCTWYDYSATITLA